MIQTMSFKYFSNFFSNTLFTTAAFLLGFRSCIGMSPIGLNMFFRMLTGIIWGMFFFCFLLNSYSLKEYIIAFSLFIAGWGVMVCAETTGFILNYFTIVTAKNQNFSKAIKNFIWGISIGFCLDLLLVLVEIFPNNYLAGNGWCFGYKNPNTAAFFAFYIVVYFEYVYYKKLRLHLILMLTVLGVLFSFLTGSRTSLIITLFSGFAHFVFKTHNKLRSFCFKLIFPCTVFIGVFVILGIFFNHLIPFFTKVDVILSGRFSQAQYYILEYGIHLFGTKILELDGEYRSQFFAREGWVLPFLDSGYARFFINYGIISFLIIIGLYWKRVYMAKKEKNIRLSLFLLNILLVMVIDNSTNLIIYNFSLIFLVEALFKKKTFLKNKAIYVY